MLTSVLVAIIALYTEAARWQTEIPLWYIVAFEATCTS